MRDRRETARQGRQVRSDASHRLTRYVLGQEARGRQETIPPAPFAAVRLAELTGDDLRGWRSALPRALRCATVRRLVNDLRAALTDGYEVNRAALTEGLTAIIRYGLRAEETEDDVSEPAARDDQILTDAEVARLLAAARETDAEHGWEGDVWAHGPRFGGDRRSLLAGGAGAHGRLPARARAADDARQPQGQPQEGTDASARARRPGRGRGAAPRRDRRAASEPLLERWRMEQKDATTWERVRRDRWQSASELTRPFRLIRERASLPDAIPYALRHTSIVRGIRANLPIRLVASAHDTSVGIIEKHYSRFIVSGLEEMLRAAIVPLVPPEPAGGNVVPMAQRCAEAVR